MGVAACLERYGSRSGAVCPHTAHRAVCTARAPCAVPSPEEEEEESLHGCELWIAAEVKPVAVASAGSCAWTVILQRLASGARGFDSRLRRWLT